MNEFLLSNQDLIAAALPPSCSPIHVNRESVLTSDRRRPDQTSTSHVSFGCWETELTRNGGVGLGGIKHGSTKVRRSGIVHLRETEAEEEVCLLY